MIKNLTESNKDTISKAILYGDVRCLEKFLIDYGDDPYFIRYNEALKAQSKESAGAYDKACSIISYTHNFNNWKDFENYNAELSIEHSSVVLFEKAVDAVVFGDINTLNKLVTLHPHLVYERSVRNHHATLLLYIGANGVEDFRQKTPFNAVEVAEMLLLAGAEDAIGDMYGGTTTLGLVATSVHPVKAGIQKELIDVLLKYGADINHGVAHDHTEGLLINACLHNGRCEIVEYLAEKGAKLDLEGAAGVGLIDEVKKYYNEKGALINEILASKRDLGLMWACGCGRKSVVEFILGNGFDLAKIVDGMTALHWAVMGGHMDIIQLLLEHNAPLEIENSYGGTVLGQALWSAYNHAKPNDTEIIKVLIDAGAIIEKEWENFINETLLGNDQY